MAASFDQEQLRLAARVMSDEQRAKYNTQNEVLEKEEGFIIIYCVLMRSSLVLLLCILCVWV